MQGISILVLLAVVVSVAAYGSSNPLKTKKYKCIELNDDEEIQIVKKKAKSPSKYPWKAEEEKAVRKLTKNRDAEEIEMPKAKAFQVKQTKVVETTPASLGDVSRDSQGRPLILSPQHCGQVKHYAQMYGVKDVGTWVKSNCAFARMYAPGATCEEINILVASCYKKL